MRRFYFAIMAVAFALSLGGSVGSAATMMAPKAKATPCRDAKGKFMKCSMMKPMPKKTPCRDAKGKFTKCKM